MGVHTVGKDLLYSPSVDHYLNHNMGGTMRVNCKDRLAARAWKLIGLGHALPHFSGRGGTCEIIKEILEDGMWKSKERS